MPTLWDHSKFSIKQSTGFTHKGWKQAEAAENHQTAEEPTRAISGPVREEARVGGLEG